MVTKRPPPVLAKHDFRYKILISMKFKTKFVELTEIPVPVYHWLRKTSSTAGPQERGCPVNIHPVNVLQLIGIPVPML